MFETLYYKDNYLKEFKTIVKECIKIDKDIKIVLQDTAFYPEGGGQSADKGFIDGIKVLDVQEKDGKIYHTVEKEIEVNKEVECKIDFEYRFLNMQHHTAEHIVSGLICKTFNCNNVGFHMGKDFVTMDFNFTLTKKQVQEIEDEANEAVMKNIEIIEKIVTEEAAEKIDYRSKKKLSGNIRLVEVPGYELCACCGIHVNRTGEIGAIKILSVEKYKSGSRISMICGKRAMEYYAKEYDEMCKLSVLLSSKHENIFNSVVELKEEIKNLKIKISKIQNEIFENELNKIGTADINVIFKEDLESNDIKKMCQLLKEKSNKISAVFSKENNVYKYMIMSDNFNVTEISKIFNKEFNGRGGGNTNLVQGQVCADRNKLEEIIKNIN